MPNVSITHLLIDTGTVQRLAEVPRGNGRFEKAYVDLSVNIDIRVFTAGSKEQAMAHQLRLNCTHSAYTEPDQDIAVSDRIVRTARDGVVITLEYYRVTGIIDPSLVHHRKLMLERVTVGTV